MEEANRENANKNELKETKKYELKLNADIYIITMEMYSNETINFKATLKSNLSLSNYSKIFTYEELIKKLIMQKELYVNVSKIFKFYDTAILKNRVSLVLDKNKKILKLSLRKIMDFDEIDCVLDLDEAIPSKEEQLNSLFNQINEIKTKNDSLIYEIQSIKELMKNRKSELENKINLLIDENKKKDNTIEELKNDIKTLIKENKENKNDIEEMKQSLKSLSEEKKNSNKNIKDNKKNIGLIEKNMIY
jgi:methyl-accepting chemotaxis protein